MAILRLCVGVQVCVSIFCSFLPMVCPGIQIFVSISVCSGLCIGILVGFSVICMIGCLGLVMFFSSHGLPWNTHFC
jgi:hypothetical protein